MHRAKRMKGLVIALLITAAVTGCAATNNSADTGATSDAKQAIASYNQGEITEATLNEKLLEQYGMSAMLEMVDKGILDEVQPITDEIKATAEENLANLKSRYGDKFSEVLKSYGLDSEEEYMKILYLNLQRQAYIVEYVKENVITDEEVQAYYDAYTPNIEASHILIKPEGDTEADWTAAHDKAMSVLEEYKAGADFAELAKEYSDDPGSGMSGGALGSFGKGAMVEPFETAAYALEVGGCTEEPVKSQFGYHIILKTGEDEKKSLEDMKDEISQTLTDKALSENEKLGYKALIAMRENNGFTISNDIVSAQYKAFTEQMQEQQEETKTESN